MAKKFCIIIHGPLEEDFFEKNIGAILKQKKELKVVISTYKKDAEKSLSLIQKRKVPNNICFDVIHSDDVFNPGFFNINRQINLVNAALDKIDSEYFLIKVRMDQSIDYNSFFKLLSKYETEVDDKLITTNCYTRADRWYHPSDMFLAGDFNVIRNYYPQTFFKETHMDNILMLRELVRNGQERDYYQYWPESRLFVNFILKRGDEILMTHDDSLQKLKKHTFIINTWDISLKWKKFLKGLVPVLPYSFKMSPFRDGPMEDAYNYNASDLNSVPSLMKEKLFKFIASLYFTSGLYHTNPLFFNYKHFVLRVGRKIFDISLKFIPPIFHNTLVTIGRKIYYAVK